MPVSYLTSVEQKAVLQDHNISAEEIRMEKKYLTFHLSKILAQVEQFCISTAAGIFVCSSSSVKYWIRSSFKVGLGKSRIIGEASL